MRTQFKLQSKINSGGFQQASLKRVTLKGFLLPINQGQKKNLILQTKNGNEYLVKFQREMHNLYSSYEYQEVFLRGIFDTIDNSITVYSIDPTRPKKLRWYEDLFDRADKDEMYYENIIDCAS
jgi:hypothetical protein